MKYNFTKEEIALLVSLTKHTRLELDKFDLLVDSDDEDFHVMVQNQKHEIDKLLRAFLQDPYIDEEMIDYKKIKED